MTGISSSPSGAGSWGIDDDDDCSSSLPLAIAPEDPEFSAPGDAANACARFSIITIVERNSVSRRRALVIGRICPLRVVCCLVSVCPPARLESSTNNFQTDQTPDSPQPTTMSSWERSRYIPWDRIPLPDTRPRGIGEPPPVGLETQRERIFRDLKAPAAPKQTTVENNDNSSNGLVVVDGEDTTTSKQGERRVPYSHLDFARQAAFGACIGTITGAVFGFMDGMRTAGESSVLQNASNMAKGRYLLQGTTRSATVFGAFFCGFHVLKYGLRVAVLPPQSDVTEIVLAAPVAIGALLARPSTRAALPYGSMLIFMDSCNLYMRQPS